MEGTILKANTFTRWLPAIKDLTKFKDVSKFADASKFSNIRTIVDPRNITKIRIDKIPMNRRTALSVAGLALVGGAIAGPVVALDQDPAQAAPNVTAVQSDQNAPGPRATPVKPADKSADRPGMDKLSPHGAQGPQSSIPLDDEQVNNAKAIIEATHKAGLDERAAVIAVATSMQESKLENLGHLGDLNDHDSLGLFQQRPSSGWGAPDQITDPDYATTAFLNGLKQIDGWHDMPLTDAAQHVQVSAYPFAYAQWEQQAAGLVADYWNG